MNGDKLIKSPHYITSPFGYRTNPVTKKPEGHNGNDYGTNGKKIPCYAVDDGIVLKVSQDRFGANFVYVKYPKFNHLGLYYHLDSVSVKIGQKVTSSTQIGIVGTTGQSTGIHLHFSWIKDNANAMKYYQADYEDFEKYIFEEEKEVVETIKIELDGKVKDVSRILVNGANFIELRDLSDVLDITYDGGKKMPVVKRK